MHAVEHRQWTRSLVNLDPATAPELARLKHPHPVAFAAMHWFFNARTSDRIPHKRRRQQVGVTREHLPQQRQDRLVREHHFPRRLDKGGAIGAQVLAEALAQHPLPWIELEQGLYRALGEVGETSPVPTDL